MKTLFKSFVTVVGAIVTFLLGGSFVAFASSTSIFIAFDYVLGDLVAASYGQLNSKIEFRGIVMHFKSYHGWSIIDH